jgi:hypothetical protein
VIPCRLERARKNSQYLLRRNNPRAESKPRDLEEANLGSALYRQNIVERYGKLAIEQGNSEGVRLCGLESFVQSADITLFRRFAPPW